MQATSVLPCRGAPVHPDTHDVAQCLGEKLVWTTKPCAFSFLCWGDCFPTSSGANLISVGADTWLMCIIMQGSTCHLQWKTNLQTVLESLAKIWIPFFLTNPTSQKIGRKKKKPTSIYSFRYIYNQKKMEGSFKNNLFFIIIATCFIKLHARCQGVLTIGSIRVLWYKIRLILDANFKVFPLEILILVT